MRIGVRDLISLEVSLQIVRHYEIINHKPAASELHYDPVIKNFKLEFDSLEDRKSREVSTPQIS